MIKKYIEKDSPIISKKYLYIKNISVHIGIIF